jgi:hypothetical protein
MAPYGQAAMQLAHPMQVFLSITDFLFTIEMAFTGQTFSHEPQPMHFFT